MRMICTTTMFAAFVILLHVAETKAAKQASAETAQAARVLKSRLF